MTKCRPRNRDTYVFIDVSNIRSACLKTLGIKIDFVKLLQFLKRKYPNLKDVRYYEGIAKDDVKKRELFESLKRQGYTICGLERKTYDSVETDRYKVKCPKCENEWVAKLLRRRKTMKSNVDVYLASDMIVRASLSSGCSLEILLLSCDGDYAEALEAIFKLNPNIHITVLATPLVRDTARNTLSTRLRRLGSRIPSTHFALLNINDIRDYIS